MSKILMMMAAAFAMAVTFAGCDEERAQNIATAAANAYGSVRPEVVSAAMSHISGDINDSQLKDIAIKFGEDYFVERFLRVGDENGTSSN